MSFWYDRQGKPIPDTEKSPDSKEWLEAMKKIEALLTDRDYKIVKQEFTNNKKYWVSTVWLGLDHGFSWRFDNNKPNPHPIIFETMVFKVKRGDRTAEGLDQVRYETEEQASKGHIDMVAEWNKK